MSVRKIVVFTTSPNELPACGQNRLQVIQGLLGLSGYTLDQLAAGGVQTQLTCRVNKITRPHSLAVGADGSRSMAWY